MRCEGTGQKWTEGHDYEPRCPACGLAALTISPYGPTPRREKGHGRFMGRVPTHEAEVEQGPVSDRALEAMSEEDAIAYIKSGRAEATR